MTTLPPPTKTDSNSSSSTSSMRRSRSSPDAFPDSIRVPVPAVVAALGALRRGWVAGGLIQGLGMGTVCSVGRLRVKPAQTNQMMSPSPNTAPTGSSPGITVMSPAAPDTMPR